MAAALHECLTLVSGGDWCGRCGALLADTSAPGRPVMSAVSGIRTCRNCRGDGPFDGFVRLGRYEPPLDRLVRHVKEQAWHAMARELGVRLGAEVLRTLVLPPRGWVVVPIPADPWRRLKRGIDHADEIAQGVELSGAGCVIRALRGNRGSRQAAMDRSHRWSRSARLRLRPRAVERLRGQSVLLVDDVRTTGATLFKARELLLTAGVRSVAAAVICVADKTQVPS